MLWRKPAMRCRPQASSPTKLHRHMPAYKGSRTKPMRRHSISIRMQAHSAESKNFFCNIKHPRANRSKFVPLYTKRTHRLLAFPTESRQQPLSATDLANPNPNLSNAISRNLLSNILTLGESVYQWLRPRVSAPPKGRARVTLTQVAIRARPRHHPGGWPKA